MYNLLRIAISLILIRALKAQDTLDRVCYNDLDNDKCWLENVKATQQSQAEHVLQNEDKIDRLATKDCSDLLYAGERQSGIYGIYTRYNRYDKFFKLIIDGIDFKNYRHRFLIDKHVCCKSYRLLTLTIYFEDSTCS